MEVPEPIPPGGC